MTFLLFNNLFGVSDGYPDISSLEDASDLELFPIPVEERYKPQAEKRFPQHLDPTLLKFWIQVGECPESTDGQKQYYCPSLNSQGRHVCIDDYQLCDGQKNCPNAEDENRHYCLFYKALKSQVQLLERSVTTLNSAAHLHAPVRRYSNSNFGRIYHD
ncbi:Low-density lipoprotein receptor-related protein 1B [Orchesella cincta]|uniref:Low-density lipoprotein receptor-related protein 1B n=1 Tax=Orchesella cincta TaxID=48709 RepID=A0A1D2MYQ3_ORCCI|nr:Low-density lipoprotein receptor-related protein 1B [Orchesella cincta]